MLKSAALIALVATLAQAVTDQAPRVDTGGPRAGAGRPSADAEQLPAWTSASSTPSNRSCRRPSPGRSCPGAVVLIGRGDRVLYQKAIGNRALVPAVEAMSLDTVFDLASLTKVVATTTSVMILVERGKLRLNDRVATFIPGFERYGKGDITIRHLLTHVSGLGPTWISARPGPDRTRRSRLAIEEVPDQPAWPALRVQRHQLLPARRHRPAGERDAARPVRDAGDLRSARHEGHDVPAARDAAPADRADRELHAVRLALPGWGNADAPRRRPRSDRPPHGRRCRSRRSVQHRRRPVDLLPHAARRRRLPRDPRARRRSRSRR